MMLPLRLMYRHQSKAANARHIAKQGRWTGTTRSRSTTANSKFFTVSEEVRQAVAERRPVVALESTIYTHGFPHPENLALAARLESLVRINGGVPATIGVLDGVAHVGLDAHELIRLVTSAGEAGTLKVSRRDLANVLASRTQDGLPLNGGTTVAGTMILAHMAGIRIFATGGLGGVHRGAELTMDVSADLTELGRTPVTVISSGCKSFLDIPKTLEYLETQGVAVGTFADGRTGQIDFPAFYTRDSGIRTPLMVRDENHAASLVHAQSMLGIKSGLLLANPIPEEYSIPLRQMEVAIETALKEALANGATGALSTPYILKKIKELTGTRSMQANTALVEANVIRGTRVAVALTALESQDDPATHKHYSMAVPHSGDTPDRSSSSQVDRTSIKPTNDPPRAKQPDVGAPVDAFVAGSLAVDLACDYTPWTDGTLEAPEAKTSNPSTIKQSLGGVGHNVARAAHLMGANIRLCSAVADDLPGRTAIEALDVAGMSSSGIKTLPSEDVRTAQYVAVNDRNKNLVVAMADMSILERQPGKADIIRETLSDFWLPQLKDMRPDFLGIDGNWQPEYLADWLKAANEVASHVLFEPVSNAKGASIFQLPKPHLLKVYPEPTINIMTPNSHELAAIYTAARESRAFERDDWFRVVDAFGIPHSGARTQLALAASNALVDQGIPQQSLQLLPFIPTICTKLGADGVLVTQIIPGGDPRLSDGQYAPYILSRCVNGSEDTVKVGGVYMRLFPPAEHVAAEEVVSVNGVGDTFAGTLLAGLAKRGKGARVEDLIDLAQRAAVLTLKSTHAVSPDLGTLRVLL